MRYGKIHRNELFLIQRHVFNDQKSLLKSQRRMGETYSIDAYPGYDAYFGCDGPHINMLIERSCFLPNRYYFITIDGEDCFFHGFRHGDAVFHAGLPRPLEIDLERHEKYARTRTEVMNDGTVRIAYV